jgi:IS30 family transposase
VRSRPPRSVEGDLLVGTGKSRVASLVERNSRFVMLVKVPSGDTQTLVTGLARRARKLPQQLRRSLTSSPRQSRLEAEPKTSRDIRVANARR